MKEVIEADTRGDSLLNSSLEAIRKLIKAAIGFAQSTPEDVLNRCKELLKIVSKIIYSGTKLNRGNNFKI